MAEECTSYETKKVNSLVSTVWHIDYNSRYHNSFFPSNAKGQNEKINKKNIYQYTTKNKNFKI